MRARIFIAIVSILSMSTTGFLAMGELTAYKWVKIGLGMFGIVLTATLTVTRSLFGQDAEATSRSDRGSVGLVMLMALSIVGLALTACFSFGCGHDPMISYYKSVSTNFDVAKGCYEVGRAVNAKKEADIKLFASPAHMDPAAGRKLAAEWRPLYDKILTGCDATLALAKSGLHGGPLLEKALSKSKAVIDYIARGAQFVADVVKSFAEAGIKFVPGEV